MQNKFRYIPKEQRKKILLLCDDIRLHSGIATVAREIVIGTSHHFNWVNIGGAIQHPDKGKRFDISTETGKLNSIEDASVFIYPIEGYGDANFLRQIISLEKPDAIMIFTDPRYWTWLFQIENEIRKKLPIIYYNIWDDYPAPLYNKSYYESCDALLAISKQTENINKIVLQEKAKDKIIKYIPHGINENIFRPLSEEERQSEPFKNLKKKLFADRDYNFVALFNSRNIRRKSPGDVILAWRYFIETLPKEQAQKCVLVMHTQAIDQNGTDLYAVRELLCDPEYCNVIIDESRLSSEDMNYLYNMIDVNLLISSNEGWGLSLTEAMMAGKMIIANTTGGMQDQMRFVDKNNKWIEFNEKFPSNHRGTFKKCGEWAVPIFPSNLSLVGSVPTPYIFDDRCNPEDVANAITKVFSLTSEERTQRGLKAREWATSDESRMSASKMCQNMIESIDETLEKFTPRISYELIKIKDRKPNYINHNLIY
jgi:glycosyltransferase involved in cell wall biosynthesis